MKKYFFLLFALFTFSAFGQVVYLGGYTQAQIDGLTVGTGYPILYNTTTSAFARWNGSAWESWGGDDPRYPPTNIGTANKTLTQTDFWKDNFTDGTPTFIVDNSIDIGAEARFSGLGVDDAVTLTPGPGVTFYGKGKQIITGSAVIDSTYVGHIKKMSSNTYRLAGPWANKGCVVDPQQQFTTANAASDPACNEANGVTGLGTTFGNVTSSTDSQVGTYALQFVGTADNARISIDLPVTAGDTFIVSFYAKQTVGSNGAATAWTNLSGWTAQNFTGTYVQYTQTVTATATGTAQIRFYASVGGAAGDTILVDDISIIKQ